MNTAIATGYLVKDASLAYRPKSGARVLMFEAMLRADGDEGTTPWHCEMEDRPEIDRLLPLLTPGRGVALKAQLAGRPFVKDGRLMGYTRFLRVEAIECTRPDRGTAPSEAEATAQEAGV